MAPAIWDRSAIFYYKGNIYVNDVISTGAGTSNAVSGSNFEQWSTTTSSLTLIKWQGVGLYERGVCAGFGMIVSGGGSTSIIRLYV